MNLYHKRSDFIYTSGPASILTDRDGAIALGARKNSSLDFDPLACRVKREAG